MIDPTLIDPRLDDRGRLLRRAVVTVVALLLVATLVLAWGRGTFSSDVRVSAQVDDIGGALATGSDVKLDGVIVGRVESIEPRDGGVRLGLVIPRERAGLIPRKVRARILPASVFGTTFVDLAPDPGAAASTSDVLTAGQVIAQDRSASTLELQDALDSTNDVLTAVRPAQLAETLGAVATALDGRGEQIGTTMETLDRYLGRLDGRMPLLREDLRLLATNLQTVANLAPDLLDSVDSGLVTARTIVARRGQLASTIAGGTALADEFDRLALDQEDTLVRTLDQTATVVDGVYDERVGISSGFRSFVGFARNGTGIFADGPFMNTDLIIKIGEDAPYTAADCPVFGTARGDNCGGSAAARVGAGGTAPGSGVDDGAIIDRIRGLLSDLDLATASDGGVGELLLGPYVDGGGQR